ncbi:MAG TPA: acetate/propionate family kinase [Pirellulales bacterium]|jgi:acetate kinase|nr:acetate/propionate family kinase [Pirellulales bacterium]
MDDLLTSAAARQILAINGGSSSIKFALFAVATDERVEPRRTLSGTIERIGQPGTALVVGGNGRAPQRREIAAANHEDAAEQLIEALRETLESAALVGIGHRIVHGGAKLIEHQSVTDAVIAELKRTVPLDLTHLPREIALIEIFARRLAGVPQFACFDTAFHRDLPRVAKLLPIPRRYFDSGVRRFGFHGLSYTYLLGELLRIAPREADGRVIFAHLGAGASMAAVQGGKPIDTSMAFTPTAGLVMATRPGDLDPGLIVYLMREEQLTPEKMDEWLNRNFGLLGVSETSPDVRDLLAAREKDSRAAEAIDVFCYQARKWIGAYAAAMGGLEALVFSAGIGEHSPEVRTEICAGLGFLDLRLDPARNDAARGGAAAAVISTDDSRVAVRVIPTDEEIVIARTVMALVG